MYDVDQLRRDQFPMTQDNLYFQAAGITPLPIRSRNKVRWSTERLSEHPIRHFVDDFKPALVEFQETFAGFVNANSPDEIIPIFNTGTGIHAIAQALPLHAGDNIAFCEIEFPTNAYPWMSLERNGVEVRQIPAANGGLTLEALELLVDGRTRAVAVSAVQFFTGHRTDLSAIGAFCRERGIWLLVDAIQAAGHIKLDAQAMNIDAIAAGGHKSLIGPPGSGFLYVRDELAERMTPRGIGANATRNYEHWLDYDMSPLPGAARFNSGTHNIPGIFGLLESVRLLRELEIENIDQHTRQVAAKCMEMMDGLGFECITPGGAHSGITTYKTGMNNGDTDAFVAYLDEHDVSVVKHLSADGVPHVRVSFHCYNKLEEIDTLEAIIKDYER